MTRMFDCAPRPRFFRTALAAVGLMGAVLSSSVSGAQVANRLASLPNQSEARAVVPGSVSPRVRSAQMLGHLAGETTLQGMSLVLSPSAAQQAELAQLLQDQQNPSSPQFHAWLTPETYGARFGLSDADLSKIQSWLTARGFSVDSVAASRNRIVFSGTASAVETAFGTTLERFHRGNQDYFENDTEVSLPASLANVVAGVTGLSSFHLAPPPRTLATATPQYTGGTGYHFTVPWDFRQIFGLNTLVSQGFDGTGVKIGVIGQSSVSTTQLTYFQQKTSQYGNSTTTKIPTMVVVPNSGAAGQLSTDDEGESELDLEYASGSAPGATVLFIYTGLGNNNGVFDALIYAITTNQAPILTLSYGGCEAQNSSYATTTLEPILAQASSQGQTVLASSGDTGAASCEPTPTKTNPATTTAQGGISVSYPASSPNVTAVGGTQLNATNQIPDDPNTASTYWSSTNNLYKGSAIGYIPETSWNDTGVDGQLLASSGGGASSIFGKPSWQSGTGVPADSHRDVPDVAFPASVEQHGYIVCTVQQTCLNNTVFGSSDPTVSNGGLIGGTSASAPNFASMLAVVEQATNNKSGLGNINPRLYTLAAGTTASTVFHDITTGNNIVNCAGGTLGCSATASGSTGTMGFNAGKGYDMVTGLGSLDAGGLTAALTAATTTKLTPSVTLAAATTSPTGGSTDTLTFAVSGTGAAPTGTVTLTIDGATATTFTLSSSSNGSTYIYTVPACTGTSACTHTVVAAYGGDTVYSSGTATLTLTVPVSAKLTPTVSLTAATMTPALNATDVLTVTVGGSGGTPTGTVAISIDGATAGTVTLASGAGSYTYTAACAGSATGCTHTVVAAYSGDGTYNAASSASATLVVGSTSKAVPTVTLSAATLTPTASAPDVLTVTVAGSGGTPTGTVNLTIDGTAMAGSITLAGGTGTYTYTVPACATVCTHTVVANYSGDAAFTVASSASLTLTVGSAITIVPASATVSVTSGNSVTNGINITSSGFAGTVSFTATSNLTIGCYTLPSVPVTSGGTASSTMTIYTSSSSCATSGAVMLGTLAANRTPGRPGSNALAALAAGLLGVFALRRRKIAALLAVLVAALTFGLAGCGSGGSAPVVSNATPGSYTVNVTAKGTPSNGGTAIGATTSFAVTVQ